MNTKGFLEFKYKILLRSLFFCIRNLVEKSLDQAGVFSNSRLEKSFAQGGVIYVLDKSRLSIRLQAPYSEERRRKASESAKQTGFKSRTE